MTQKEKSELIKYMNKILHDMGFNVHKNRGRGKSTCLPLFVMTDNTRYKTKSKMLSSGKTLLKKERLDCDFILQEYNDSGWLPIIEDMTAEEIVNYCKKHSL